MSKRTKTEEFKLGELSTINTYLVYLKEKRGITTTKQAIHYQLKKTDNLDYVEWQGNTLIVMNFKAQNFTPKESKTG